MIYDNAINELSRVSALGSSDVCEWMIVICIAFWGLNRFYRWKLTRWQMALIAFNCELHLEVPLGSNSIDKFGNPSTVRHHHRLHYISALVFQTSEWVRQKEKSIECSEYCWRRTNTINFHTSSSGGEWIWSRFLNLNGFCCWHISKTSKNRNLHLPHCLLGAAEENAWFEHVMHRMHFANIYCLFLLVG